MMNTMNMNMLNDMELNLVAGGEAQPHGSGASGGWDDFNVQPHGGGVSGGWGPSPVVPEPPAPEPQPQVIYETTVIVVDEAWMKKNKRIRWDCPW